MGVTNYVIDSEDSLSIQTLLDVFSARSSYDEHSIRSVLRLHNHPFILSLEVDYARPLELSPLQDAFTFDMESDKLIMYTDDKTMLVDAIIEMAMYLRGFATLLGLGDEQEWKVQVAIGAWRRVRETIKEELGLSDRDGKVWGAGLELDTVERYDRIAFGTMVFLASRPDVEVIFPDGANSRCIVAYRQLTSIVEAIAQHIRLDDYARFNRRLNRAVHWIEEQLMPSELTVISDVEDIDDIDDLPGFASFPDLFHGEND